jgi:peptidyl-tRNA hydrolase
MTPGKIAAQAGHAYLNAYLLNPIPDYQSDGLGTKVCLCAPDEYALLRLKQELDDLSIPNSLIIDSGHVMPPFFDGSPVVTALGFGPVTKDKVFHLTGKLKLL